ncbi:MAG: hypothetical protein GYB65_02970 [Chloroflexi bacterium]|nr:hypothetical protein [Chloroflexota bacterium]
MVNDTEQATNSAAFDLIAEGKRLLNEGIAAYPGFDPNKPYVEKNYYFNPANNLRFQFLPDSNSSWVAEHYYSVLLGEILAYENQSGNHLNKGMVYANLGIAQISNGKLDDGFANLLTAEWEDRNDAPAHWSIDTWEILDTELWLQFERRAILEMARFFIKTQLTWMYPLNEDDLLKMLKNMARPDRIFLVGTVLALRRNWETFNAAIEHEIQPNAYTLGRLYACLKDLCLLIEALLRKKLHPKSKGMHTLGQRLLTEALARDQIIYPKVGLEKVQTANTLRQFLQRIEKVYIDSKDGPLQWSHCLHLVRNFTGHHFDPSNNITSTSGKSFFDWYEKILESIFSALLYFERIGVI